MNRRRHEDRVAGVNERIRRRGRAAAFAEAATLDRARRPGEACGTVEAEHDPLRHLGRDERDQVLASIEPRRF